MCLTDSTTRPMLCCVAKLRLRCLILQYSYCVFLEKYDSRFQKSFRMSKYWSDTLGTRTPYLLSNALKISCIDGFMVVVVLTISTHAPTGSLPTGFLTFTVHWNEYIILKTKLTTLAVSRLPAIIIAKTKRAKVGVTTANLVHKYSTV